METLGWIFEISVVKYTKIVFSASEGGKEP